MTAFIIFFFVNKSEKNKNEYNNRKECYTEFKREIKGVVEKAFFDENPNNKGFIIEFTNGEEYKNPIFEKSLNGYINKGDSLYKKTGTFRFLIFRKGAVSPIIMEDTIDCEELKK